MIRKRRCLLRLLKKQDGIVDVKWEDGKVIPYSEKNVRFFIDKNIWKRLDGDLMAKGGLTPQKARIILHEGMAHGKPLSERQRKYMGAVASGYAKKEKGGEVSDDRIETALRSYAYAGLWSSTNPDNEDEEFLDRNYNVEDIAPETMESFRRDVKKFYEENIDLLNQTDMDDDRIGHNFWLNKNGHGSGFWDEEGVDMEIGKKLSDASKKFGSNLLVIGDDGKIHDDYKKGKGGKAGRSEWFKKAVEEKAPYTLGGWKKEQSASRRRGLALSSRKGNLSKDKKYLSAGRALQALANVTKDAKTKEVAKADANYFYAKASKMARGGKVIGIFEASSDGINWLITG